MSSHEHKVETKLFNGRVRVITAGHMVADSVEAVQLAETGYHTVYYIPKTHIRMELFQPSATTTRCPHKGIASYWSVQGANGEIADVAWSYEDPLDQVSLIKGHLAFDPFKVDAIESTSNAPVGQN